MVIAHNNLKINFPMIEIEAFCRRWQISELSVFGSVLRDDFRPDSDVDFLVTFSKSAHRTLFDLAEMDEELAALVGLDVDVVSRAGIERGKYWIRREEILGNAQSVFRESEEDSSDTIRRSRDPISSTRMRGSNAKGEAERRRVTRTRSYLLDTITFSEQTS
jgi:predicted nucleotidyltransferase